MPKANQHVEIYHDELDDYMSRKKAAVDLQTYIGKLLVDKSVELVLFRNQITDITISDLLRLHKYAREVVQKEISIFDSSALAKDIFEMNLAPAKIDIGKLASEWASEKDNHASRKDFLHDKLNHCLVENSHPFVPRDVVLFGFGRIGRLAARELIRQGVGQQLRLRAIVLRSVDEKSIKKRADLFENDSVHGPFKGSVEIDYENMCLLINGQRIYIIASTDSSTIDYTAYGIKNALVIDNTGAYTTAETLKIHTQAKGVDMALLTAPG